MRLGTKKYPTTKSNLYIQNESVQIPSRDNPLLLSTDVEGQRLVVARRDETGGILGAGGVDIVIGEGIAPAVNFLLVNDATVVAGWAHSVVAGIGQVRGDVATIEKEGAADESGTETRHDGNVDGVVLSLDTKGTRVAAPDVEVVRLGVGAVVTLASELVVSDLASDITDRLGLDTESLGAVLCPDLVNVLSPVVFPALASDVTVVLGERTRRGLPSVPAMHMAPHGRPSFSPWARSFSQTVVTALPGRPMTSWVLLSLVLKVMDMMRPTKST
uniref:Uncharacterized protein n=1 Tax=Bionectria ochroleuca TaxID=29856 RepID=A0A8H7NF21_BIOOC